MSQLLAGSRALEDVSYHVHTFFSRSVSSSVLSGANPVEVDPSNPITLFIIQLVIIIVFTQCLGWAFSFIRQPKVIAEVIGGVILGPTIMGRIPGFSNAIFPAAGNTYLSLVSTIGLILFLFLVGLEVDVGVIKKNGRKAAIISAVGMVVPFGLGAALAVGLYNKFVDTSHVSFGHFLLFVGVAMSITAFPVLCRILTSTKLLDTHVGVIVLAAGVGNDVVGWVLLALTLALTNASSGVVAVYVLLCAVAWAILLLWPIRKGFVWLARRTGSLENNGPSPLMMLITLLIVFISAFVTDVIGVHPIFGGFIAGLIIPHEGGFAIHLVEKIDDLVSMLFLPIYFVQSGLNTNLGLLDTGVIWGWVILLCVVAFAGKFIGCAAAAKAQGFDYRESGAVGMLMSCKGLVELIVLNVGLSAGILNQQTFSMFVVMAIVLTFVTTPMTLWIYPARYRTRTTFSGELETSGKDVEQHRSVTHGLPGGSGGREYTSKILVVLQKIEHLAPVMLLTQMLEGPPSDSREVVVKTQKRKSSKGESDIGERSIHSTPSHVTTDLPSVNELGNATSPSGPVMQIDALKLIELTGRTYSVMQSAEKDQLLLTDDALQLFKQFGRLRGFEVTPHISIVGQDSFPSAVADHAADLATQLVLLPWIVPVPLINSTTTIPEGSGLTSSTSLSSSALSPFDSIFGTESSGSPMYTHFLRHVFAECPKDVGLFIDHGSGSSGSLAPGSGQHIFMPFFGGPDDRLALRLVVQLCHHHNVTASIVRIEKGELDESVDGSEEGSTFSVHKGEVMSESMQAHQNALQSNQLTLGRPNTASVYPDTNTQNRIQSETADTIAWSYYTSSSSNHSSTLNAALSRCQFWTHKSSNPLGYASSQAESILTTHSKLWRPLLIVTGRGRRGATMNHSQELAKILVEKCQQPNVGAELRKTVGDGATALIISGGQVAGASFLILETGKGK